MNDSAVQRLPFFPDLKDDETLYSVCARFHRMSGHRSSEVTSMLLLGHRIGGARQESSLALGHLSEATGGSVPANESTLRTRTILGSYLPFMLSTQRHSVLYRLLSKQGEQSIRAKLGLTWNAVTVEHELRACPKCIEEQNDQYGFAFWRSSHQGPGVWVCTQHKQPLWAQQRRGVRNVRWLDVRSADLRPNPNLMLRRNLEQFDRLADCLAWLTSRTVVDIDALGAMVRSRLYSCGAASSEVKLSVVDQESLVARLRSRYGDAGVKHLDFLASPSWLMQTLRDQRYAHPVRWALLLAIVGGTHEDELNLHYEQAIRRLPELDFFDSRFAPRLARAPSFLYDALSDPISLSEASIRARMPLRHIEAWMRRDPELARHRRESGASVKLRAAILTIEGAIAATPTAKRSEIISRCLWAVRWLEANAPEQVNKVLPPTVGMFDPQLRLDFGASD